MPISKYTFERKRPVQVNGKCDKKCIFLAKFALRIKIGSITFSEFYVCLNLARDLHINIKKIGWFTILVFPEKHKIYPKIVIFVLLCAIVSQTRSNAIASVQSPLAIDVYLDEKSPHASACALYALYRLTR